MTRVANGFYVDTEGVLHVDIPEMLAHLGIPDTPASRDLMAEGVEYELRRLAPEAEIEVTDDCLADEER